MTADILHLADIAGVSPARRQVAIDEIRPYATCTIEVAAQLLGIGRSAAYAAAARGEIPTLTLGRRRLVPVPRLLELVGVTDSA